MMYFTPLKKALIWGACALSLLLCIPNFAARPSPSLPWRQIHLGLDLRGGSYLLLQVDLAALERDRLATLTDNIRQALLSAGLGYRNLIAAPAEHAVTFTPRAPDEADRDLATIEKMPRAVSNEFEGVRRPDGSIAVVLSADALRARAHEALNQSVEIVRRRIDATGARDPQISISGADRIVVNLPGISDPEHVKALLGTTAKMTFRLLDMNASPNAPPPPGVELLPMQDNPNEKLPVRTHIDVDGGDLTNAQAGQDGQTGQWAVNFTLDGTGAQQFADITRTNLGKRFAIVLDNKIVSAPVIQGVIPTGSGQITGRFSAQGATDLALLLRAGALPAPLAVIEQRSIGPELGADSIRAGAISLAVGLILVMSFMVLFYGLFGVYADFALICNLVLMMGILSLFEATLTLPGMAGMLLTLGMAVDANILVNERIREEVRRGRTALAAMQAGYERATGTIIDSNVTALLAHVMLFVFGTGPVRNFALTITIGIVTTLFTTLFVSKMLMVGWYAARRPKTLPV